METSLKLASFWAALVCLLAAAGCAHAPGKKMYGNAQLGEADTSNITILGLTLGMNTLGDAQKVIGPAAVTRGEYRHDPHTVCYVSNDPADPTVLKLRTDYYGDWYRLTGFEISSISAKECCSSSKLVKRNIATPSGLRLGLTHDEVTSILGKPGVDRDGTMKYMYVDEKELSGERQERLDEFAIEPFDRDVTSTVIELDFTNGRVSRLRVRWSESI